MDVSTLLDRLNSQQKQAVKTTEGPLLILAGAGSGKTRVITYRIAYILSQGLASPDQILAVTFTNKAAQEMKNRITHLISDFDLPVFSDPWVSTFHSMCVRILKQHLVLLGYAPGFSIYNSSDQNKIIKEVLKKLDINEKAYPIKNLASKINRAKTSMLFPENLEKNDSLALFDSRSLLVYHEYEVLMKASNALDFSDLLLKTYQVFKQFPDVLKSYQEKFHYIHVDEYQDTNRIQYQLIKFLASKHDNLCVVGDEDQSIYSWQGADVRNILDFESDFGGHIIKLEKNYRSSANIVKAANQVISNNTSRKSKTLFTDNPKGDPIVLTHTQDEYDEARFVARKAQSLLNSGCAPSDMAIFYRTNAQSRVLEEQLRLKDIPYKIIGGIKFYERKEVKDLIAYLKVIMNPNDDLSLKRIINVPLRGIGKTTVEKISAFSIQNQCSFLEALRGALEDQVFNRRTAQKLSQFLYVITNISHQKSENLENLYRHVLEETQYIQFLQKENSPESQSRIENLEELNNAIVEFSKERQKEATLQSFLEEMSLVSDGDQVSHDRDSMLLMTLHVSKGLEFPIVFMVGMEEGLFPGYQKIYNENEMEMEEERRLCYVGMTRAKEKLYMIYAQHRKVWGRPQSHLPSRFLGEVPDDSSKKSPELLLSLTKMPSHHSSSKDFISSPLHSSGENTNAFSFPTSFQTTLKERSFSKKTSVSTYKDPFPDYENVVEDMEGSDVGNRNFKKGIRVKHPTFGFGSICETEGHGDNKKVSILFNDNTMRKFVVKYARLEIL